MDKVIIVSDEVNDKRFAFKSEKGFFRWMKATEHTFGVDKRTEHEDRGVVISSEGCKRVSYDSDLYSTKDVTGKMPK